MRKSEDGDAGETKARGMKVLIVKPTALGDVAQALKVVPWLKRSGKASRVDWVVDSAYLPVLEICPDLDRLIGFPRQEWRRSFSPGRMLAWAADLRRESYDVVLDLQGLARSGLMTRVARARHRVGLDSAREGAFLAYSRRVDDHQHHAVDRYAAAVAQVLGEATPRAPLTFPCPATPLPDGLQPGRYTVFHPYSLWPTKLWPWQRFQALAQSLEGEPVVWVGSGTYFPTGTSRPLDLRGRTPLPLLLSLLAQARAVISTDSGPAHLAALFDVPLITLFGATDPALTSPRSPRGEILTAAGLPCRPCLQRNCHWKEPMDCLAQISVEQVAAAWKRQTSAH